MHKSTSVNLHSYNDSSVVNAELVTHSVQLVREDVSCRGLETVIQRRGFGRHTTERRYSIC
jgi:hypothetical protein